jgi:hypothetical protein
MTSPAGNNSHEKIVHILVVIHAVITGAELNVGPLPQKFCIRNMLKTTRPENLLPPKHFP